MWYFAWILGVGFAVLLAILNALWLENAEARQKAFGQTKANNDPQPLSKSPEDGTVTHGEPTEDISQKGKTSDNEPI